MVPTENTLDSPDFVARDIELARLQSYLEQAVEGNGRVIFVTGEAGAGKTTLVTEFARQAQQNNGELLFVVGNCNAQTGRGDPYLPFRKFWGCSLGTSMKNWPRARSRLRVRSGCKNLSRFPARRW